MLEGALGSLERRGEALPRHAPVGDDDHLARLHLALVLRSDEVEGTGFGGEHVDIAPFVLHGAVGERSEPALVSGDDDLVGAQQDQRIRTFQFQQGLAQGRVQRLLRRTGHQVRDDFGVASGVKDGSALLDRPPQGVAVGQVAVVGDRQRALVALDVERLRIARADVARSRVARMADRHVAGQLLKFVLAEDLADEAHAFARLDGPAVAGANARALLAPVLQGVEA